MPAAKPIGSDLKQSAMLFARKMMALLYVERKPALGPQTLDKKFCGL